MFSGDLSVFTVGELLQVLATTGKTGLLRLRSDHVDAAVLVRGGAVCVALLDMERPALAARLVTEGLTGELGADRDHDVAHDRGSPSIWHGLGTVGDDEALQWLISEHTLDVMDALMRCVTALFEFVPIDPVDDWPWEPWHVDDLLAATAGEDGVPRPPLDGDGLTAVPVCVPHPPSDESVDLTTRHWKVIVLLDGRRSVADVLALSGLRTSTRGRGCGSSSTGDWWSCAPPASRRRSRRRSTRSDRCSAGSAPGCPRRREVGPATSSPPTGWSHPSTWEALTTTVTTCPSPRVTCSTSPGSTIRAGRSTSMRRSRRRRRPTRSPTTAPGRRARGHAARPIVVRAGRRAPGETPCCSAGCCTAPTVRDHVGADTRWPRPSSTGATSATTTSRPHASCRRPPGSRWSESCCARAWSPTSSSPPRWRRHSRSSSSISRSTRRIPSPRR